MSLVLAKCCGKACCVFPEVVGVRRIFCFFGFHEWFADHSFYGESRFFCPHCYAHKFVRWPEHEIMKKYKEKVKERAE